MYAVSAGLCMILYYATELAVYIVNPAEVHSSHRGALIQGMSITTFSVSTVLFVMYVILYSYFYLSIFQSRFTSFGTVNLWSNLSN